MNSLRHFGSQYATYKSLFIEMLKALGHMNILK